MRHAIDWWAYVVAYAARTVAVAVVCLVVQFFGCHVTCAVECHTAVDEVTDIGVDQRVVDNLVASDVPRFGVAMAKTQRMRQHVVQRLVCQ